jgi:hypothetical protein
MKIKDERESSRKKRHNRKAKRRGECFWLSQDVMTV